MNSSVSYFDLLEIPEGYLIEEKVLRQQFLKKSRETHPDFFSVSPALSPLDPHSEPLCLFFSFFFKKNRTVVGPVTKAPVAFL